GTAPSTVAVSITTTGLVPGSYYDTLVVSGNATNSPQRVPITYTVSAPPTPAVISLSPAAFSFTAVQSGSLPSTQNLQITNTGGGTLTWSQTKARNSSWLAATPASGTAPSTVAVSITTTGLTPGSYYDTLVVSGNATNSPQRVAVMYTVSAPPPGKGYIVLSTTTCESFSSNTSSDLPQICYVVKNGKVWSPSPNSFLYLTQVTAPSASFTIDIAQTNNNGAFPLFEVATNGVILSDGNCTNIGVGTSPSVGQVRVSVIGAVAGQAYIVSVKYSTNSVSRTIIGSTTPTVRYDFATKVNGVEVTRDADGLGLANCAGAGSAYTVNVDGVELLANYPNPFNASTNLRYSLPQDVHVRLDIYNMLGQRVHTLVNEFQSAGEHSVLWDGRDAGGNAVASGVYFFKVDAGNQIRVQRMTLLK
ncbi:MAG: FlgD immunoglobulin-like domain containing protein, partial [Limisphaerales bacterium]